MKFDVGGEKDYRLQFHGWNRIKAEIADLKIEKRLPFTFVPAKRDAKTGKVAFVSPVPLVHRVDDATTKEGTPFTGEFTYEMDFSSVTNEGTYFVRIPSK